METLIGLVFLVGVIYFVHRMTRGGRRGRRRFKCHDCLYMRKVFDDGAMCSYGDREVFKNPRHIAMCPDWTPTLTHKR
ncbi:MAG: hypothetical protein ACE5G2_05720 [Candidatus Krumholzibacteriia bacterium]